MLYGQLSHLKRSAARWASLDICHFNSTLKCLPFLLFTFLHFILSYPSLFFLVIYWVHGLRPLHTTKEVRRWLKALCWTFAVGRWLEAPPEAPRQEAAQGFGVVSEAHARDSPSLERCRSCGGWRSLCGWWQLRCDIWCILLSCGFILVAGAWADLGPPIITRNHVPKKSI